MTKLDQFESLFRAAGKDRFKLQPVDVRRVLVVTDLPEPAASDYAQRALRFLSRLPGAEDKTLRHVTGDACSTLGELLARVESEDPDLVITYRNHHSGAWRWPYTLGDHVEVLTQATAVPILLLPRIDAGEADEEAGGEGFPSPSTVMAMTDHLAGDHHIVSWAAAFAPDGGRLVLCHVEDDAVLDRYLHVIGRTPEIDTEVARRELTRLLLKEPEDFVGTCGATLAAAGRTVTVEPAVRFGHHVATYRDLVRRHGADLLVLNTKDEDQLAMHGGAYPLVVELRSVPVLLI